MAGRKFPINGVMVQFPYEPYDCQMTYMSRVIEALQKVREECLRKNQSACLPDSHLADELSFFTERRRTPWHLSSRQIPQIPLLSMPPFHPVGSQIPLSDNKRCSGSRSGREQGAC